MLKKILIAATALMVAEGASAELKILSPEKMCNKDQYETKIKYMRNKVFSKLSEQGLFDLTQEISEKLSSKEYRGQVSMFSGDEAPSASCKGLEHLHSQYEYIYSFYEETINKGSF